MDKLFRNRCKTELRVFVMTFCAYKYVGRKALQLEILVRNFGNKKSFWSTQVYCSYTYSLKPTFRVVHGSPNQQFLVSLIL